METKTQAFNRIRRAIERAKENGFNVVVASDPEGNNWNTLNPLFLEYDGTNKNSIALGVFETIDEDTIFIN